HGHGFLIDDISVGPLALDVRPLNAQRANLLDNTTKGFNVLLRNLGAMTDVVRVEFDAFNSSAPEGSVSVPDQAFTLRPNETTYATVYVTLPRDPSLLPTDFKVRILARSLLDPNAGGATLLDLAFGPRQWAELTLSVDPPVGIVQEATDTFIPIRIENNGLVDSVPSRVRVIDEWAGGRVEHTLDLSAIPSYSQAPEEALRVLEFRWRPERGSVGPHTLTFEVDPEELGQEYTRTNNIVQMSVEVSDLLIPDLHIANFSALTLRNAVGGTVTPGFDADVARYEVTAGEIVSFQLRVANAGRAGATNVNVRPFIGALSLPAKTIPYIPPGTDAIVTFNWLAQKGEHKIEFDVRIEQVELSSANNVYPGRGVTLLTVKGYEVAVEIPDVDDLLAPASEIMVPFRITNNGNAGEDLRLVAKAPAGMTIMLPREGFFLRAGETYDDNARLILAAEAVAGQQFISIEAIARENPMKVASGRAALSVLASYGGSVAGGYAVGAPPEIVVPVDLVNEGNSLEPWKVVLQLPPGWTSRDAQPAEVVVPAHARVTHNFHLTMPTGTPPGDRVIAVKATMPNGETREGVARVGVSALRAASLVVEESAPKPDKGALTVPVRVQNTGNVQQPFSVLLIDPPAGVDIRVEPSEFLLPPGGEAIASIIMRPNESIAAGTYAISGYTRFDGVIPQTREGLANVQTLRVPIMRQDLRVTTLEFSPRAELDAGDRVTVKATIQNFGQFEVTSVPAHLFVDDVFMAETVIPTIAPGGRVDVTFNWTALLGVHTLTVVVDPYKDTVDASREDNAVSVLATVGTEAARGGVAAGRADAPLGGAWLVVAAVALGMLLTRKVGPWRRERR
ncbi:MAG TPA: CARDB domain-containing protein, partial [Candidatus Thermoplasmatota archaeon]|nr:CARDB domain-containing protein [Candidatus Thermoplasmatota archaeon]